jgi:hypothetical protein
MFIPVPPKTSLPITTPNAMPSATCHSGMADGDRHEVDRQERQEPEVQRVRDVDVERRQARLGRGTDLLVARVEQREQRARQQRDHDRDHRALQVDAVAHVRAALRAAARAEQEGVGRFVERVELLELPALLEVVGELVDLVL